MCASVKPLLCHSFDSLFLHFALLDTMCRCLSSFYIKPFVFLAGWLAASPSPHPYMLLPSFVSYIIYFPSRTSDILNMRDRYGDLEAVEDFIAIGKVRQAAVSGCERPLS